MRLSTLSVLASLLKNLLRSTPFLLFLGDCWVGSPRRRCFSIGQPSDSYPSPFAKYCASKEVIGASGMLTSTNHTIAFSDMVLPLVKFLLKHL